MILATDVHYPASGGARAAGVLFDDWASGVVTREVVIPIDAPAPYVPGRFFERELPCLLAVIEQFDTLPDAVIIDGYVSLGADAKPGLGAHLYAALGARGAVIGVAKTRFEGTPSETAVVRGTSRQPLFVTAAGMDAGAARALVKAMHGPHRIPTMLRAVDRLCRREPADV